VPWTEAEIEAAKAICKELLTGDPLDYEPLPPIKEGVCGTPAPVLLRAVGTEQKVVIDPPATMSCPMADVLGEWLRDTVQPEAKKLFGSTVEDPEFELLCSPPLRRCHGPERARARQCVRRVGVRARQR
jgi:hypothetical protein